MANSIIGLTQSYDEMMDLLRVQKPSEEGSVILVGIAEDFEMDHGRFHKDLQQLEMDIVGGIFPGIILGDMCTNDHAAILRLDHAAYVLYDDLDDALDVTKLDALNLDISMMNTIGILIDAQVVQKSKLLNALYNQFGTVANYIGAGTGRKVFDSRGTIICNKGLLSNAAIVISSNTKIGLGVAKGWAAVSRLYKVTEAIGNQIISLNWRPALEAYHEVVREHSQGRFPNGDLASYSALYPIGISKYNDDLIVRFPFKTESDTLFLLDEIDEGSFVHVLHGNETGLLRSAQEARVTTEASKDEDGLQLTLIIDCIQRYVMLGPAAFEKEIALLRGDGIGVGALTCGEIGCNGETYLDMLNQTAVVGLLDAS